MSRRQKGHRVKRKAPRGLYSKERAATPVTTRWVKPQSITDSGDPASDKQRAFIQSLARELEIEPPEVTTKQDASRAIGQLKQIKKRQRQQPRLFNAPRSEWAAREDTRSWTSGEEFAVVEDAMRRGSV